MITLLPQDLINKISAGEVVERPASVVKELTENAIDAGATKLEIVLEEGGRKRIQIIDNGAGMNEEDAKLCLFRHATSKIKTADDLFNLHSLGFRGEALASIAAVSQFELLTKKKEESSGYRVFLGKNLQPFVEKAAANKGTEVIVNTLFYQIPARQKFLKTAQTELTHILRYLQQLSLVHPNLEISCQHQGKKLFHYFSSSLSERVENVFGKEFSSKLILAEFQSEGIEVGGYIAKPELVHATHKNQYLFINDRPVYDHLISRAVLDAYGTLVPRGYFPAFVLSIQIAPELVDVNVHPRKSEVKFRDPSQIIRLLKYQLSKTLQESDLVVEKRMFDSNNISKNHSGSIATFKPNSTFTPSGQGGQRPHPSQVKQVLEFSSSFSGSIRELKRSAIEEKGWKILGQIHLSFILVETPEGLQLLDQHAVSEISNYHRLTEERKQGEVCSQRLLIPELLELTSEEISILEENQQMLKSFGWEIDQSGEKTIQVGALPEILKVENIHENVQDILSQLKEEKEADMTTRELALIKYEACRGAVMFGDLLSREEMEGLLNQWIFAPNNAACEHGRPASARISLPEMRKFFKR